MNGLPANGSIRTLTAREMPLLREHLLRLDPGSRRDRFHGATADSFVDSYAARCLADVFFAQAPTDPVGDVGLGVVRERVLRPLDQIGFPVFWVRLRGGRYPEADVSASRIVTTKIAAVLDVIHR